MDTNRGETMVDIGNIARNTCVGSCTSGIYAVCAGNLSHCFGVGLEAEM